MKANQKIALIGLGKMGAAIAEKLLEAGHLLVVFNRTRHKTEQLQKMGAQVADSIQSAISDVDIVFTSVIDDEALLSVSKEILAYAKKGLMSVHPQFCQTPQNNSKPCIKKRIAFI